MTPRAPLVIGGTGGSGTRAVAAVVRAGGGNIGANLNHALDDREIADFHDRWINLWLTEPEASEAPMRRELTALLESRSGAAGETAVWGWKCPTSIYLLPFLDRVVPGFRFLHVVRDGRDMAFSRNQNQLRKHGDAFLGDTGDAGPRGSIVLWSRVNEAAADFGERIGDRYLRVRFEALCDEPLREVERILAFTELDGDPQRCAREVEPPSSLGRWRGRDQARAARLERLARPALRRFGYLASDRSSSVA